MNAGVAFLGRRINIWTILPGRSKDGKKEKEKKGYEQDQEGIGEKTPIMVGAPAVLLLPSPGIGYSAIHKCFAQPCKGI